MTCLESVVVTILLLLNMVMQSFFIIIVWKSQAGDWARMQLMAFTCGVLMWVMMYGLPTH
jgi:hypothetical protein